MERAKTRLLAPIVFQSILACTPSPKALQSNAQLGDDEARPARASLPALGLYDNASESPLIQFVDAAKRRVEIEIYEMKEPEFHSALFRALDRKVKVQIVVEPKAVGGCNLTELFPEQAEELASEDDGAQEAPNSSCDNYLKALSDLQEKGAEIHPFSKALCGGGNARCVQHGKLVVVDDATALISTGNFNGSSLCSISDNADRCNRDYSVIINDEPSLKVLNKILEKDFIGKPYKLDEILSSESGHILTVSPFSQQKILSLVHSAKESIDVEAQYLKEPELNAALVAMAQKGVKVRATLASACSFAAIDDTASDKLSTLMQPMVKAGIDLKMFTTRNEIEGKSAYLHAKAIVVDGKYAWVGSINGSAQSFLQNREFGILTKDATFVAKLRDFMQQDHTAPENDTVARNLKCERE